jgi:hypothetical protein
MRSMTSIFSAMHPGLRLSLDQLAVLVLDHIAGASATGLVVAGA